MCLQVKEQLTTSYPATEAQRTKGQVVMRIVTALGCLGNAPHIDVFRRQKGGRAQTSEAQTYTRRSYFVSPVAACKGQTHCDFCQSGIFRGLAKTHSSHALELVLLIIRLTPDPRLLVPLSFQPGCLGQVPSCEAESDHSHGYIY